MHLNRCAYYSSHGLTCLTYVYYILHGATRFPFLLVAEDHIFGLLPVVAKGGSIPTARTKGAAAHAD